MCFNIFPNVTSLFLMQKQIPTASALSIINARNSITADQCGSLDNSETSVSIVETSEAGFLGVYNPDTTQVHFFSFHFLYLGTLI